MAGREAALFEEIIGTRLLTARMNLGYSQRYVAECIGISRYTYISIENGTTKITLHDAIAAAEVLQLYSLDQLTAGAAYVAAVHAIKWP